MHMVHAHIPRWLLAGLALLWSLCTAHAALAQPFAPGSTCLAQARIDETYSQVAARPERWSCGDIDWSIAGERALLRFDLRGTEAPLPELLVTRLGRFSAMRITTLVGDGQMASRVFTEADMRPGTADWVMSAPVPDPGVKAQAVIMQVDHPRHIGLLGDARLATRDQGTGGTLNAELMIAALCGMFILPFLFNFMFFRVLRARFLVWHGAAALFMFAHTFFTSGLSNRFIDLSIGALSALSSLSFCGGVSAAMLFAADLIEPGKLDPWHRRALRWSCLWLVAWTAFYLFAGGPFRVFAVPLYFASFVPLLGLFVWTMAVAASRRSRSVLFQIAAWSPFMVMGVMRIVSALGLTGRPMEFQNEQHIAIAIEIIVTTMGVADRLNALRRQRDSARADARFLEAAVERDHLTGLLNRRGIEQRFEALCGAGVTAMALVDLDHFKQINDNHGHAVGDEVLRSVAEALTTDPDIVAVRMGGEEFLLLVIGADVWARAERARQAIPARIAANVPGLNQVVTASMGLVEQPLQMGRPSFALLYSHCDRLLYEAKGAGRNRTMAERMQRFGTRKVRKAAAAAA